MFTRYAVNVGDTLWTALYSRVNEAYSIEGVYEDEAQKFAILKADDQYYRLDFSISENGEITFAEVEEAIESYTPDEEPQFSAEDVQNFVENYKKKDKEEDKEDKEENKKTEDNSEEDKDSDGDKCPECGKSKDECECEGKKKDKDKKEYALEEIPEYVDLANKFSELETNYNTLLATNQELEAQLTELREFKNAADRKTKQDMIDGFYMLSDEDKADVIANIDTYSLDDIEAKLSIICVRNKVSFNLDDDKTETPTTYNLSTSTNEDESVPAWVKAALAVAKNKN